MLERFFPFARFENVGKITDSALSGMKFAILDIDNTLVPYTEAEPTETALEFLQRLKSLGIEYAFVSNNNKKRVELFNRSLGAYYVAASKKPFITGVKRAMHQLGANKSDTVLIGDQVFTDVYAGNRAGVRTILVDPIEGKETPFFAIKRWLEKIVLRNYKESAAWE